MIEILVVILIIGILAAIAIPVFLNQRQTANDAAVESAVHDASIAVNTLFTNNPNAVRADVAEMEKLMKKSPDVRLTITGNHNAFCVEGAHRNGKKYIVEGTWRKLLVYSSSRGATYVGNVNGQPCADIPNTHVVWNYS